MEYYILSLIISFIIFAILQFIEYRKINHEINNNVNDYYIEPYNLFHINNILLFIVIYIVITVVCFYVNTSNLSLSKYLSFSFQSTAKTDTSNNNINNLQIKEEIDPRVLSKINDNFNVGFEPFTSDASSISSTASSMISNEESE
jgi:hypothetical protein